MSSKQLRKLWPKVRNSINSMGRHSNYQAREVARTIEIQRQADEPEAHMYGQITMIQNELNLLRNPN